MEHFGVTGWDSGEPEHAALAAMFLQALLRVLTITAAHKQNWVVAGPAMVSQ